MASADGRVDILMVEDNPNDEELTLHELRKYHLANTIQVVRDGQEALEYIFCTGRYADRDVNEHPNVISSTSSSRSSTDSKSSVGSSRTRAPAPFRSSC